MSFETVCDGCGASIHDAPMLTVGDEEHFDSVPCLLRYYGVEALYAESVAESIARFYEHRREE